MTNDKPEDKKLEDEKPTKSGWKKSHLELKVFEKGSFVGVGFGIGNVPLYSIGVQTTNIVLADQGVKNRSFVSSLRIRVYSSIRREFPRC